MKTLVVIPTYNEVENIAQIVPAIFEKYPELSILVVDDNSPDGTGKKVEEMRLDHDRLHLLSRAGKEGLGRAYLAGFAWGIENNFDLLVEMDADFSHRIVDLGPLISAAKENDFAIGSRWVKGGGTQNWSFFRKLISRGGSLYSRFILGYPVKDWTGGFNAWKVDTLKGIDLASIKSDGYSFQIELKYRASKRGYRGVEVPILFEERRVGQSKMSSKIVLEAITKVWQFRTSKIGETAE